MKNYASFIECTSEICNTQIDYAKDLDDVFLMYNLIECSNDYSKTESLWKFLRDEPDAAIETFASFKSIIRITGKTLADGIIKNVENLSSFWKSLKNTFN